MKLYQTKRIKWSERHWTVTHLHVLRCISHWPSNKTVTHHDLSHNFSILKLKVASYICITLTTKLQCMLSHIISRCYQKKLFSRYYLKTVTKRSWNNQGKLSKKMQRQHVWNTYLLSLQAENEYCKCWRPRNNIHSTVENLIN